MPAMSRQTLIILRFIHYIVRNFWNPSSAISGDPLYAGLSKMRFLFYCFDVDLRIFKMMVVAQFPVTQWEMRQIFDGQKKVAAPSYTHVLCAIS